jgi:hypothetical protein
MPTRVVSPTEHSVLSTRACAEGCRLTLAIAGRGGRLRTPRIVLPPCVRCRAIANTAF